MKILKKILCCTIIPVFMGVALHNEPSRHLPVAKVEDAPEEVVISEIKEVVQEKLHPWEEEFMKYNPPEIVDIQVWCVAKAIFHEARGERGERPKILVAQVIMNRMEKKAFPDTPCEVVYQPSRNKKRPKACQFSFTCNTPRFRIEDEPIAWEEAYGIAARVVYRLDRGHWTRADHYHVCGLEVGWSKEMEFLGRVGKHCFYQESNV